MPDYNKGDFTQQGYDGYVSGGLHLNEKRCLTAKISTDEDTAGLDSVEINIHDHLNDLDYTITGENLTVGENTIGGGGIELYNLSITLNTTDKRAEYFFPVNQIMETSTASYVESSTIFSDDEPLNVETSIIKGDSIMSYNCLVRPSAGDQITISNMVNCTVQVNVSEIFVTITGDNASFYITIATTTPV